MRIAPASAVWMAAVWLAAVGSAAACADAAPRRLNVLFIAVDDLNCNIGCYGHPFAKTPNIDRLAQRGVRFDRAYCQVTLCNPTRTSLLSGRRPDATRIFDNATPPRTTLGPVVFLPEYFHQHGYYTARVGKIAHGNFEQAVSWDFAGDPAGVRENRGGKRRAARRPGQPENSTPVVTWGASSADESDLRDGRTARRVVELLREHRGGTFFIGAGFHKPHLPWFAPQKYVDMFPPQSVLLPREPKDVRRLIPPAALVTTRPDGAGLDESTVREAIAAYAACTAFTDAQIGLLLQTLDELELWDKTVVVFFGDHGFHLGDHGGLWGKLTLFEATARVPLIVAAPGKKAGVVSPRLVEFVDLYPTLLELCGLPAASGLEGTSFVPLLDDPDREWKKAAFTQVERQPGSNGGSRLMGRSIRTQRWRYTEWGGPETAELYDHDRDPLELENLAGQPEQRATIATLRKMLSAGWREAAPGLHGNTAAGRAASQ